MMKMGFEDSLINQEINLYIINCNLNLYKKI